MVMHRRERLGGARHQREYLVDAKPPAPQPRAEILPFEPLHHQVGRARGCRSLGHIPDNARMRETGEKLSFPQESLRAGGMLAMQNLDRHGLAQDLIPRPEDLAHATRPCTFSE